MIKTPHHVNVLIGKRLKAARNMAELSQAELANKMEASESQIAKYEQGLTPISIVRLVEICNIFQLPVGYFVHDLVKHSGENSPLTLPENSGGKTE